MRNIFSYQYGTIFTGKEINNFIEYNINNNTSHKKDSIRLMKQFIFKDECHYYSYPGRINDHSPVGIMFRRVNKYEHW